MGVGRRMKKQGPPPPLDESRYTQKRKSDFNNEPRGKKRKASGEVKPQAPMKPMPGVKNSGLKADTKGTFGNGKVTHQEQIRQAAAKPGARKRIVSLDYVPDDDRAEIIGSGTESPEEGYMSGALLDSSDMEDLPSDEIAEAEIPEDEPSKDELPKETNGLAEDALTSDSSVYDSDDQNPKAIFSDDSDSDAEEKLNAANIEGLSQKLSTQQATTAAAAQAELEESALQTNITADTDTTDPHLAPDLQLLRSRLTETIRILSTPSLLGASLHSRSTLMARLTDDICLYYGYSAFLANKLLSLFPPSEAFAFFESNETPRPLVIRTNTLRTSRRDLAQSLINRGVVLEPVGKWSKTGLQIFESAVPLGATPEYLSGKYILQAASSFLPVMALAPQEHERILDMAAAPGGKTSYISALMKNTGCIFANDSNRLRAKALIGNIHRLGCRNTIICAHDARDFPKIMGGFDRVLLDAPCTGTGVIAKDPSVKTNKTETDFLRLPHLQKQLLLAAIDSVDHTSRTGGYIVYSTCSVTIEENEAVVQYALSRRPNIKIVDTGLSFGVEGFRAFEGKVFEEGMAMARRFYPHKYNVDGFFVCKIRKMGPSPAAVRGDALREGVGRDAVDGLNGSGNGEGSGDGDGQDESKAAISEEDGMAEKDDDFGGFDDSEDEKYIERARRANLKRKGINPKAGKKLAKKQSVDGTVEKGSKDETKGHVEATAENTGSREET